jgi:alpha-N-arabinofuranosidase
LLEEVYNLEDALLVGGLINSLLRNADRVKIACLAQLINVIAPIMTDANGILQQTIYYPYSWALQFARGAVLDLLVQSSTYEVSGIDRMAHEDVAHVDVAGSLDHGDGKLSLFILNRDLVKAHEVEVIWEDTAPAHVNSASMLTGDDLKASNTFTAPQKVVPQSFTTPEARGGRTRFEVPARSYSVIQWSL